MNRPFEGCDNKETLMLLKQNNACAWEYFYDKYAPSLYGKLVRMTTSKPLATEILQQSFTTFRYLLFSLEEDTNLFIALFRHTHEVALKRIKMADEVNTSRVDNEYPVMYQLLFGCGAKTAAAQYAEISQKEVGKKMRNEMNMFRHNMPFEPLSPTN